MKTFGNWITGGISRELYEETGYRALPSQFQYLGFGRDFGRSGKPQAFFSLDVPDKSTKEMEYLWKTYTTSRPEFQDLLFIDNEQAKALVGRDAKAVRNVIGSTLLSEELRTNLALALSRFGLC